MARPSKLDDLTAQRIIKAIRNGIPRVHAARMARVDPATLFRWLAKGRAGEEGFCEFYDKVREAEAYDVEELLGFMREHAKVSHQACAWLLGLRQVAPRQPAPKVDDVTPEEADRLIAQAKALP